MPNDYFHTGAGARYLRRAEGDLITERLRGNIYVLLGTGANIIVLSGEHGKFLVDNDAIKWADKAVEHTTDKTIVIPGHGPVGTRTDLIAFRDMLVSVRDKVAALKRQGKSSDEVIAEKPTAAFDEKWGQFVIDPVHFIRLVYAGL